MGDVDAALARIGGDPRVVGRGIGAYIALLIARAAQARARRDPRDGPGLAGGPTGRRRRSPSGSERRAPRPVRARRTGRDVRPPDYATLFVRLALAGSDLEEPIAVAAVFRPEWLDAVVRELGVVDVTLAEALATYAG